ncbi:uncharacterized protein N7479_008458 [Penicillium vulpinum]|uniref:Uncharacterized protein n=1 Tax=Penicillium vulpinum TaxID=29845 RepID=A0A1V6RMN7_9EURO|nr:uncharacterized protein N7479_008458 [Penicillium vulpinum]KAJ5961308.1 hypothetical protein N7479_008458 [Penicillium vulpinum]OQE02870.1 hypothetical protein PENVUL_c037G05623 [Penicillium vulpinum]
MATHNSQPFQDGVLPSPKAFLQVPIAVVGMACRLPGHSTTPKKLWDFLERGGIASNDTPSTRFNLAAHHDGSKKPKTMRTPGGMFIEEADPRDFDAGFFGISGADAAAMDPQQRQLMEVVYECLENSGVPLEKLYGAQVACHVGSYAVDYDAIQARDPEDRAPGAVVGIGRAMLSNRISHYFNFKGPSMTIDTACSGSLVGLDVVCRYLHTGEVDGAIIGGANMYFSPEHNLNTGAMSVANSLSGRCHTFDEKADGYCKAEAINCVYLKRLSDAVRDGDPIRGVIRGSATNSDGNTPGIASPNSAAQAAAIRSAYAHAGITNLNDTSYLEFHGTGTQAGDPLEASGVSSVFSPTRKPEAPLYIGSVKSNIGHSEPAAGISGLIKAVLSIEKDLIPGNPTFITPTPKIDFEGLKVQASRANRRWPVAPFKRASVNSFGYGGSNAHVIVEEPKVLLPHIESTYVSSYQAEADLFADEEEASVGQPQLLVLSANDEASLRASATALKNHLTNPNVKVSLEDLSHTLSERRSHHFNRGYLITDKVFIDESSLVVGKKSITEPRVGFIFTGQGAQWPQMGKAIIDTFPEAREIVVELDKFLQDSSLPPSWSLLSELIEPRGAEHLRQPEFSQPLVTALQIALVDIFKKWGVSPKTVVGHSSGEIAAAYAAGLLSKKAAIRAAYYRGQAAALAGIIAEGPASQVQQHRQACGMLATGIGAEEITNYLQGLGQSVQIACYNSPSSLTLSGTMEGLTKVQKQLTKDSKFARMLQVNVAYHSTFMDEISHGYTDLLAKDFEHLPFKEGAVRMFSSVTGKQLTGPTDSDYWKSNMVCPVRFDAALTNMLTGSDAPDFLIELGPAGALKGPTLQVLKSLGSIKTQYTSAMARGATDMKSIFQVAGSLHIAGGKVSLNQVNKIEGVNPKVVVDLPNYSWNHSTKYWYESEASKDWRNRLFPPHDLLGSKVLGSPWQSPAFMRSLNVQDLPWIADHKMGPDIVFPATGYISMAIEAIYQRSDALHILEGGKKVENPRYRLRNVQFKKALVLPDNQSTRMSLSLTAHTGVGDWFEFRVSSLSGTMWTEHVRGLIRIDEDIPQVASAEDTKPLEHPVEAGLWHKAMLDAGYSFGPKFLKQVQVEARTGARTSRSVLELEVPESKYPQSKYPMHPAAMDGCLQTCAPSLWKGNRHAINAVLVPAMIDSLVITSCKADRGLSLTSAAYVGLGRPTDNKNYMSDARVYDPKTGSLLLHLSGLRYTRIDTGPSVYDAHTFSAVVSKPDVSFLSTRSLQQLAEKEQDSQDPSVGVAGEIIKLAAHKKPTQRVLELNFVPGVSQSVWASSIAGQDIIGKTYRQFVYRLTDPKALVEAGQQYTSEKMEVSLFDPGNIASAEDEFDFVVVRLSPAAVNVEQVAKQLKNVVKKGGQVLFLRHRAVQHSEDIINGEAEKFDNGSYADLLKSAGLNFAGHLAFAESNEFASLNLSCVQAEADCTSKEVSIYQFLERSTSAPKLIAALKARGWNVTTYGAGEAGKAPKRLLVLDELDAALLPTLSSEQWESLKSLLALDKRILWVTTGSQTCVSSPNKAMIHGLGRTVRAEDPLVQLTTLDVSGSSTEATLESVETILERLGQPEVFNHVDSEFIERNGLIYINRIQPDDQVNAAASENFQGSELVNQSLHDSPNMIRLRCERVGTTDSLIYSEVAPHELPLDDNKVEVEVYAAGLNYKDVVITMGIVPENEHILGLEGAGIVRRLGKNVHNVRELEIGQRVLVFKKGAFSNRVHAEAERVFPIPDSMTFEETCTLASSYLTGIHSLFDLADTKKGSKVLIHSASGGLGLACIQLCQYIGAEVFATCGNHEKRDFLVEHAGVPTDHIFNSRDASFGMDIMAATNGYGVDTILNSLTGDLLDESWRCIAAEGTMVELGKRDMLDRKGLSMEPFSRNASYRCFDMGHDVVSDAMINNLLKRLFVLLDAGHVKPVHVATTFGWDNVSGAMRYMRSANHIGKIVITSGDGPVNVPVRPSRLPLQLRGDVSYFLIGGLKGLCGSVAVNLAGLGAKHIVVMARSGYGDEVSQRVISDLAALGCGVTLGQGDVSKADDVRRVIKQSPVSIGGVIQGAMVLRDRIFTDMSIEEYHSAVDCKVAGTWNIHNALIEENMKVDFFTMLSSISGVVGQKGQANYAAANAFLDAFAIYRRSLGLAGNSVDLGAIQDVGYMSHHVDLLQNLSSDAWTPINEALMLKIVGFSITQQIAAISEASAGQLVTSIAVPQRESSNLLRDARFSTLNFSDGEDLGANKDSKDAGLQALHLLVKNKAAIAAIHDAIIAVAVCQFTTMLSLSEPMEPAKAPSSYGLDSLAAVEFRNWVRLELKVEVTTLDIISATSLEQLAQKIVARLTAA